MDSALYSGCLVPEYYDSMIAKLAVWGRDRHEAIGRMKVALDEMQIIGIPTTIPLHTTLMRDDRFIQGDFDTTYLNEVIPRMNSNLADLEAFAVVAAAVAKTRRPTRPNAVPNREGISKWRIGG